jgi:hypothetical protein
MSQERYQLTVLGWLNSAFTPTNDKSMIGECCFQPHVLDGRMVRISTRGMVAGAYASGGHGDHL